VRLAIISDIHSNLEALRSVLDDIDRRQADRVICLGDIVGYGAEPSACVRLVRERAAAVVLGNHDAGVLNIANRSFFNPAALEALLWTSARLGDEELRWLSTLPYRYSKDNMLFVHAAPRVPEQWEYVFGGMEARRYSRYFHERLCFLGHSHVPGVYPLDPEVREYDTVSRFLINVGSVGQPRDGDWRACYGMLDSVAGTFTHIRVEYDVAAAMHAILKAGLPKKLAERLKHGT
jgi:diadenosine tetraphosphatase ApaH/serine/threonine PP2A family protein phosphatase